MERQGEEVHVSTEEARSAETGVGLRYVLALSLALVVVIYAAVWLIGSAGSGHSGQAADSAAPAAAAS